MTMTTVLEMLKALENDVTYFIDDTNIRVTFEDFEGYTNDWEIEEREYHHPELVENFLEMLEKFPSDGQWYETYQLNGFTVTIGYTSFEALC